MAIKDTKKFYEWLNLNYIHFATGFVERSSDTGEYWTIKELVRLYIDKYEV